MFGAGSIDRRLRELEHALIDLRHQLTAEIERRDDAERLKADEAAERFSRQASDNDALRRKLEMREDRLGQLEVGLSKAVEISSDMRREQLDGLREVREALARHAGELQQLSEVGTDVAAAAEELQAQKTRVAGLQVAIGRLERRLDIDSAEAAKTAIALLERIDRGGIYRD